MENYSNQTVNSFLEQRYQESFLSVANRNGQILAGEHEFTCDAQVSAIRKSTKPYITKDQREVYFYDALLRIKLTDKPGIYLVGARTLGLQPLDFLSENEHKSEMPLMKWPSCRGTILLTLVTKDKDGNELDPSKQYYRIAVSLKV